MSLLVSLIRNPKFTELGRGDTTPYPWLEACLPSGLPQASYGKQDTKGFCRRKCNARYTSSHVHKGAPVLAVRQSCAGRMKEATVELKCYVQVNQETHTVYFTESTSHVMETPSHVIFPSSVVVLRRCFDSMVCNHRIVMELRMLHQTLGIIIWKKMSTLLNFIFGNQLIVPIIK